MRQIGQHRMRGVTEQRDPPLAPARKRGTVEQCPFLPALACGEEVARTRVPLRGGKAIEECAGRARGAPARLAPIVIHDGNDVDHAPGLDGVMHEMRVGAEPEIDCWKRGALGCGALGCGVDRNERAPRGLTGRARRSSVPELLAQRGP